MKWGSRANYLSCSKGTTLLRFDLLFSLPRQRHKMNPVPDDIFFINLHISYNTYAIKNDTQNLFVKISALSVNSDDQTLLHLVY